MNIPELSTTLSNISLSSQVGTAVLSKALDSSEATGNSMIKMMEQSVNPAIGSNFDMSV